MKPTFKAYVAGLMDGEGCIAILRDRRGYYKLQIQITQKYPGEVFRKLERHFGGSTYDDGKYGKKRWQVTSRQATKMLMKIIPYLELKRDQAALAIVFSGVMRAAERARRRYNGGSEPYPEELVRFQRLCHDLMKTWKRVHPPTETEREGRFRTVEAVKALGNKILERMRQSTPTG